MHSVAFLQPTGALSHCRHILPFFQERYPVNMLAFFGLLVLDRYGHDNRMGVQPASSQNFSFPCTRSCAGVTNGLHGAGSTLARPLALSRYDGWHAVDLPFY